MQATSIELQQIILNGLDKEIISFDPKVFLPFASGIEWCASENNYLNEYSVKADDVESILMSCKTPPLVLKPHTNKTIMLNNMAIKSEDFRLEAIHDKNATKEILLSNSEESKLLNELDSIVYSARTKLNQSKFYDYQPTDEILRNTPLA